MRELQIANPDLLEILATLTAPSKGAAHCIEKHLHRRFYATRRRGEWFDYSEELGDLIRAIDRGDMDDIEPWLRAGERSLRRSKHELDLLKEVESWEDELPQDLVLL